MNKLVWLILSMVCVSVTSIVSAASNPVVQIVWYDAVWWSYPNMIGWGSASIIDSGGLIITNNHVVDDGRGSTLWWFSICITTDSSVRPVCHYTASLIARDVRNDVALLRIDAQDIFGKKVDLASLSVLPVDYDYVPKTQDTVTAVWYPRVWASTITKTQGIIAWVQSYNDAIYIKTDAQIAGGNSGGPLLLWDAMIGINTFGMWGYSDPTLWYALSVSQIKDFIQEHSNEEGVASNPFLNFHQYLRQLETINLNKKVQDDFLAIDFSAQYNITHYIPNLQIRGELSNPDIYHVQEFNIQRIKIPKLENDKQQEYFIKNQLRLYGGWSTEKLKVTMIGWVKFYEPVYSSDPSDGEWYGYKRYFSVVDQTMIIITLSAPLGNANTQTQVKDNIAAFLQTITFGDIAKLPLQTFTLANPSITLPSNSLTMVDLFGQMDRGFSEYYGWNSTYIQYQANLYESNTVSVKANTLADGKGKSAQQLLDAITTDAYGVAINSQWLVDYYGNKWYVICGDQSWSMLTDMQGRDHNASICIARLVVGEDESHSVTFILTATKLSITSRTKDFYALIDQVMKQVGDITLWVTIDPSLQENQKTNFNDIGDQDPSFQKFVSKLVQWKAIKDKPSFNGDYPLQRQDYIPLYLKMVYNKNLTDLWSGSQTYGYIIATLPYTPTAFVPMSQWYDNSSFAVMLMMKLAGVKYADMSEVGLSRFVRLKDTTYSAQRNQIQQRSYDIYGQNQIDVYQAYGNVSSRASNMNVTYNPLTHTIKSESYESSSAINLDQWMDVKTLDSLTAQYKCYTNSVSLLSNECLSLRREQIAQYASYSVLTKWDAVSILKDKLDVGLFEAYRAAKKTTQIEE